MMAVLKKADFGRFQPRSNATNRSFLRHTDLFSADPEGPNKKAAVPVSHRDCRSYLGGACGSVSRIRSARIPFRAGMAGGPSSIWAGRRRPPQAAYLHRLDGPPLSRQASGRGAAWPFTPWGLHGRSGRPERRCALTAPLHPLSQRLPGWDCSLLHMPSCR